MTCTKTLQMLSEFTAADLWAEVWPNDSFLLATPEDRKLFADHAASLNLYYEAYPERKAVA